MSNQINRYFIEIKSIGCNQQVRSPAVPRVLSCWGGVSLIPINRAPRFPEGEDVAAIPLPHVCP